jgi:hypothetical protein
MTKTTETPYRERKNYYKGKSYVPKNPTGPSATKLQAREELKALKDPPPKPTTVEEALAQCVEANRAKREEHEKPSRGRLSISMAINERWREAIDNLFAIIDPDHKSLYDEDDED